jgi:hypothetical protein
MEPKKWVDKWLTAQKHFKTLWLLIRFFKSEHFNDLLTEVISQIGVRIQARLNTLEIFKFNNVEQKHKLLSGGLNPRHYFEDVINMQGFCVFANKINSLSGPFIWPVRIEQYENERNSTWFSLKAYTGTTPTFSSMAIWRKPLLCHPKECRSDVHTKSTTNLHVGILQLYLKKKIEHTRNSRSEV